MKEFKSLLILLLLTCSMAATAQTTMKEAFKAYMQANPSATNFSPEILRNALEMMNAGLIKNYDETKSKQLVDNYLKEKFTDDAVDAMLPYMEEKLKVEEVNELTAKLSTDKGKSFVEHWSKINGNTSKFEQLGKEMAEKVLANEEPTPIQPIKCPGSYKKLFQQFYEIAGQKDFLSSMFDGLSDSFTEEQENMMTKIKNYLSDNLNTMMLNESYGIMTEEDLKYGIELSKTQAWQNQMKFTSYTMSHAQEMGMSILMKYVSWLQEKGVETNM